MDYEEENCNQDELPEVDDEKNGFKCVGIRSNSNSYTYEYQSVVPWLKELLDTARRLGLNHEYSNEEEEFLLEVGINTDKHYCEGGPGCSFEILIDWYDGTQEEAEESAFPLLKEIALKNLGVTNEYTGEKIAMVQTKEGIFIAPSIKKRYRKKSEDYIKENFYYNTIKYGDETLIYYCGRDYDEDQE